MPSLCLLSLLEGYGACLSVHTMSRSVGQSMSPHASHTTKKAARPASLSAQQHNLTVTLSTSGVGVMVSCLRCWGDGQLPQVVPGEAARLLMSQLGHGRGVKDTWGQLREPGRCRAAGGSWGQHLREPEAVQG